MSKRKGRSTKSRIVEATAGRGFDLGQRMRVMALPDITFNQLLIDAGVIGCAYGLDSYPGYEHPVPALTLIATDVDKILDAFEQFSAWGAAVDGDVVDITLVLQSDGRYQLWVGPEPSRALHRILPHAELCDPLLMGVSWIKQIDSTNTMVHQLRRYLETQRLAPVLVGAASGDPRAGPDSIKTVEVPRLLKFDLAIVDEEKHRERYRPSGEERRPVGASPNEIGRHRSKVLSIAFPVSKERVRRQKLPEAVRRLPTYSSVSSDQVAQAAINLLLSDELNEGDRHFGLLGPKYHEQVWQHIFGRTEVADGKSLPCWLNEHAIAKQVEMDVRHVLREEGVPVIGEKFQKLQALFLRKGYADG
jgi:hypothetical protein